jgi:hypothetical protein
VRAAVALRVLSFTRNAAVTDSPASLLNLGFVPRSDPSRHTFCPIMPVYLGTTLEAWAPPRGWVSIVCATGIQSPVGPGDEPRFGFDVLINRAQHRITGCPRSDWCAFLDIKKNGLLPSPGVPRSTVNVPIRDPVCAHME